MDRKIFAVYTLLIGGLIGVVGDLLFYNKLPGLSFPLFLLLVIVVVLASGGLLRQWLRWRNLWVLIPALFFAAMIAVRAESTISGLNLLAAAGLCALGLHYLPLTEYIDLDSTWDHCLGLIDSGFGVLFAPLLELGDAVSLLFERLRGEQRVLVSVGRGLLIAVPVLAIFGVLFVSADAVFASYVDRVLAIFNTHWPTEWLFQVGFVTVIGWGAAGTVAYGVARRSKPAESSDAKPKQKLPALGMIEASLILGSVDLLFGLFVIVQFAYFFGGYADVITSGRTFSEYARHGFFELVAVSVLTLGLVLLLDSVTVRHAQRHTRIFRVLAVLLVGLTGVILVSASKRMLLYEAAYGFTYLRVYTQVFMYWLAVLFGFFLLALFRMRVRIFSLGLLIMLIGYVGTLNLMNVDLYIAQQNITRYQSGETLDFSYLNVLSTDAAPAIIDLYQTTLPGDLHSAAGQWLAGRLYDLDGLRAGIGGTIFSANLSRDSAYAALDAIRVTLPQYDPRYFYRDSYSAGR